MDNAIKKNSDLDCEICYRIICRQCGWEATQEDVLLIQKREVTECPDCGWSPGTVNL